MLRLAGVLEAGLEKAELIELFRQVEIPLVPVLARIERAGVRAGEGAEP